MNKAGKTNAQQNIWLLIKTKKVLLRTVLYGSGGVTILKKGKRCNGEYLQVNSNKTDWEVSQ